MTWGGADVTPSLEGTGMTGSGSWNTNFQTRGNRVNTEVILDNLLCNITTNLNTGDGATCTITDIQVATSLLVTYDQATGTFTDTTNTATISAGDIFWLFYVHNDNSVTHRTVSVRVRPTTP